MTQLIRTHGQTVADLRQRFAKVKEKFDRVELDIETHGANLGAIKTDIVNFAAQSEIYEGKLSTAMLNSDSMDIDTPSTECEPLPSCVRATTVSYTHLTLPTIYSV